MQIGLQLFCAFTCSSKPTGLTYEHYNSVGAPVIDSQDLEERERTGRRAHFENFENCVVALPDRIVPRMKAARNLAVIG